MATIRKHYKKWQVIIRRKFHKTLRKSFTLKEDAEKFAREKESEIDKGLLTTFEQAQKTTLGELLERYQLEITSKKKSNDSEKWKIKTLQKLEICNNYLMNITPTKIAKLRDDLLADRKPGTVNKYLSVISNCWNIARREWGINLPDNPCTLVKKPAVFDRRDRILTDEEYKRILSACELSKLHCMKGLVEFAWETGCRRGEILRLTKQDCDFFNRTALLRDTKNGEDARIALSLKAVQILKEQVISTTGHFFNVGSDDRFKHHWKKVLLVADVKEFRFHDIRACYIVRMLLPPYNMTIPQLAVQTRHKTWKELQRYARLKASDVLQIYKKIGN